MRKIVFYTLSVVCIPFFLIGLFSFMLPILMVRGKVSGTTYEPFNARLQWDMLGLREDKVARTLAGGLPATNLITRLMVFRIIWLICRISGYVSPPLNYPAQDKQELASMVAVRTEFFDRIMSESIRDGDQVVILGAGWDTRAYGLLKNRNIQVFEIDTPATQQVKLRALQKTGVGFESVNFVSCDFNNESWLEKLQAQGFDSNTRTFLLWEGVTMYLDESAIHETLETVSRLATGSIIAFDFLPDQWWNNTRLGHRATSSIAVTYGEKFTYFIEDVNGVDTALESLLQNHRLTLQEKLVQYLKSDDSVAFYGMLVARKEDCANTSD